MSDLHAIWRLTSFYAEAENGYRNYVFGEEAGGLLTYLPEGYMSAFLMNPARTTLSQGLAEGTPEEIQAVFAEFDAYPGRYTVDAPHNIVTHHVEYARLPAYIGTDLVRHFTLDGDTLNIHTPPFAYQGMPLVLYANWARMTSLKR